MGNKRHSSHEMRQIADRFSRPSDNPYCLMVCRPSKCGFIYSASNEQKVEEMLLQAADLEEELKRSIADTHAAIVERDALKAQIAEIDAKWESRVELQKRCTETVQNELNQANARLSAVIKECDYQVIDYHPKSSLARCLKEFDDAVFEKIKAIAKGGRK